MIWFTADTHFGHSNILGFHKGRGIFKSIEEHDEYLIKYWNETIDKRDTVYIIGDLAFADCEKLRKLMIRLNGNKILIKGNHDKIQTQNECFFNQITLIKKMKFKKTVFSFLEEDFEMVMCHFPMVTWEHKQKGVVMIHGHCHGNLDNYNLNSKDLRVDVGLDSKLGNYKFLSLEQIYRHFKNITGKQTLKEYAATLYEKNRDVAA